MRTSFFSCARSSWLRRASALLLAVLPATAAFGAQRVQGGDIEQAWYRLAQLMDRPVPDEVRARTDELLQATAKTGVRRLTPLALALVVQARAMPRRDTELLLRQAIRLDPGCPEAWLALADGQLRGGRLLPGLAALGHGTFALFADQRLRGFVAASALLAAVVGTVLALVLWSLLAIGRAMPRLWHDLTELGVSWRLGSNGVAVSLFIVALPIFVGGDPVWLLLWVFALSWAYFTPLARVVGAAALLLTAALPTLVETGARAVTHPPNVVLQAAEALADRRYEPQVSSELQSLNAVFGSDPEFFRLLGDTYRESGLLDQATITYRQGLQVAPRNAALSLALGTVRYTEGDYNAALQSFLAARDNGYDAVVVDYDLSLTYAQTYHFHESDEAITAARAADGRRLAALMPTRDRDLIAPVFTLAEARALLARQDPVTLINRGLLPPPLSRARTLSHPLAVGGLLALIIAVLHLVVRQRLGGFASACLKCGRPFCHRCKLSRESQSYCTQCVNIFLKKDMVGIDAQLAKRQQLQRRQVLLGIERRVADVVLPGLGLVSGGRTLVGWSLMVAGAGGAIAAFVWLPSFIAPALMAVPLWPLELAAALVWGAAVVVAQLLRVEWR